MKQTKLKCARVCVLTDRPPAAPTHVAARNHRLQNTPSARAIFICSSVSVKCRLPSLLSFSASSSKASPFPIKAVTAFTQERALTSALSAIFCWICVGFFCLFFFSGSWRSQSPFWVNEETKDIQLTVSLKKHVCQSVDRIKLSIREETEKTVL